MRVCDCGLHGGVASGWFAGSGEGKWPGRGALEPDQPAACTRLTSVERVFHNLGDMPTETGTQAIDTLRLLNRVTGQMSVFALALVFGLSLLFSHFIAGPIYRFEKTLEAIRDGDLTIVVRLRARDEFKEMAELFNQALASLRLRLQTERDVVDAAAEKAGKLAESLRQAGHAAEAGELERLISPVRELPVRVRIK